MEQLTFRCARRDAELLGNLFVAVSFHIMQHQHGAISHWQQTECSFEIHALAHRVRPHFRLMNLVESNRRPPVSLAEQFLEAIDGYAGEPRTESRLPPE